MKSRGLLVLIENCMEILKSCVTKKSSSLLEQLVHLQARLVQLIEKREEDTLAVDIKVKVKNKVKNKVKGSDKDKHCTER
eukprot:Pgem_evm1s15099